MSRRSRRSVSTNTRTGGRFISLPTRSVPRASESIHRSSWLRSLEADFLESPVPDFVKVSEVRHIGLSRVFSPRVFPTPRPPVRNLRTARLKAFSPVFSPSTERQLGVCASRRQRRQVLFALGVGGKAGGSPGPYKRTIDSSYRCR